MPKFLAIHEIPSPIPVEEATSIGRKVRDLTSEEVRWTNTWVQLTRDCQVSRIYCCWEALDADSVRSILDKVQFPTEGIYPMAIVDPSTL